MKLLKYFVLLLLIYFTGFSQKETYNWYFGLGSAMTFETDDLEPVRLENSSIISYEACASISDDEGNLLFYTNGTSFWNRQHERFAGPLTERGNEFLASSSSQGAMILPHPGIDNQYYVFFTPQREYAATEYFSYSIVDMTMNAGLGGLLVENVDVARPYLEASTTVKIDDNSYWILVNYAENSEIHAFKIDESGLNENPVISDVEVNFNEEDIKTAAVTFEVSPKGDKLVVCYHLAGDAHIYEFDKEAGVVGDVIDIIEERRLSRDAEFSHDGSKLYISLTDVTAGATAIRQYDMFAEDISESGVTLYNGFQRWSGLLELAPNRKIYYSTSGSQGYELYPYLGVVHNPWLPYPNCNYQNYGVNLEGDTILNGLPHFPKIIYPEPEFNLCNELEEELIINGDFEAGNTGFITQYNYLAGNNWATGFYKITDKVDRAPAWTECDELNPTQGNFMLIDATNSPNENLIWEQTVPVEELNTYIFTMDLGNVNPSSLNLPVLNIYINGELVGLSDKNYVANLDNCLIKNIIFDWESQTNIQATIQIYETSFESMGADFFIDDISFRKCNSCEDFVEIDNLNYRVCPNETKEIGLPPVIGWFYTWEPADAVEDPNSSITRITSSESKELTLYIQDESACTDEIAVSINRQETFLDIKYIEGTTNLSSNAYSMEFHKLLLTNNENFEVTIDLDDVYLDNNIYFSSPSSQFPITLPAGETKELEICFSPNNVGDYSDIISIQNQDICYVDFNLTGTALQNRFNSNSRCETKLEFSSLVPRDRTIFPNPAQNSISIRLQQKSDNGGLIKITSQYGDISFIERFSGEANLIELSNLELSSGAYLLQVYYNGNLETHNLMIVK